MFKKIILNGTYFHLYRESLLFNTTRQVPSYSKSIITPNGQIFLTGGSGNQKRFKQIYQYNYESNTLDLVCKMKYQRSSHAICYSNGMIYIIGGFSQNQNDGQASKTCQIFSIKDKKCSQIASLNAPSANSCAVVFNDQYIFKFGGIENKVQDNNLIQMYSIKKNKWYIVQIQVEKSIPKLELLSFGAGIQINETDLMIFGGYDNSDIQKPSRSCYIAQVRIKNYNQKPLPNPQGFWNNNPILWNGKVIALQNITDQENQLTALKDQRKVIFFDGKSWN